MENKKNLKILTIVAVAVIILCAVLFIYKSDNCAFSGSNLDIAEERIAYTLAGNDFAPKVIIKAKNTSGHTVKTSFSANIYYNGELFDSVLSEVLTLEKGDTGTFTAPSAKFVSLIYYDSSKWTYNITKWNNY